MAARSPSKRMTKNQTQDLPTVHTDSFYHQYPECKYLDALCPADSLPSQSLENLRSQCRAEDSCAKRTEKQPGAGGACL